MKITNFKDAFSVLMVNEGKFTNDPKDPGNWTTGIVGQGTCKGTMFGVTCKVAAEHGYTGDMRYLPREIAEDIAKKKYWDPLSLDSFDPEVAFQVLDTNYNGGHAAMWLQRSCGAQEDGKIGPQTIAAVSAIDPQKVIMRFNAYRIRYLVELSIWPSFGKGWMNRIANNLLEGAD